MSRIESLATANQRLSVPWPWESCQLAIGSGTFKYKSDGARMISRYGCAAPHLWPEQDDSFWIEEGYTEWVRTWYPEETEGKNEDEVNVEGS